MRLLAATDIHAATGTFSRILDDAGTVDLVLLGGDLTHFGSPDEAQAVIRLAQAAVGEDVSRASRRQQSHACRAQETLETASTRVLAVAGNCDSPQIEARLAELGVSLFRRGVVWADVGFVGLSAMPPWRATMYHFSEDELAEILEAGRRQVAAAKRLVVLSHSPPHHTKLDRVFLGRHVGSRALRAFVDRVRPELVVCGHIHEARGVVESGRTTVVNCGPAVHGCYARIELPDEGLAPHVELRRV